MIAIAAKTQQGAACMLQEIADSEGCSLKYLAHVLAALAKAGLVKSRRGRGGGYFLGRPAVEISLKEIIRHAESALSCGVQRDETGFFDGIHLSPFSEISNKITGAVGAILVKTTLQELVLYKERKALFCQTSRLVE
jgi:Rrf2 family transcriptional regulator, iron-sulfur cluster assembly transcription factor